MWDGYDLNVWFAEPDESSRRKAFLRLIACVDRATRGLQTVLSADHQLIPLSGNPIEAVQEIMDASPDPGVRFTVHAKWELWSPHVTWPSGSLSGEQPRERRREDAQIEHLREEQTVYAVYVGTSDGVSSVGGIKYKYMPATEAGNAYVHLGDGIAEAGQYGTWHRRPDVAEKIKANRSGFHRFLSDVMAVVKPAHLLVTSNMSRGEGVTSSLLVYHQDAREFLRDALRELFLLADRLRLFADTSEGAPLEQKVSYMDDAMKEPERLCSRDRMWGLHCECMDRLHRALGKHPDLFTSSAYFDPAWFHLFTWAPDVSRAITSLAEDELVSILRELGRSSFRPQTSGFLLMDDVVGDISVNEFFARLAWQSNMFA